ncbi:unnamed protein product [Gadus morhua 'NCC']
MLNAALYMESVSKFSQSVHAALLPRSRVGILWQLSANSGSHVGRGERDERRGQVLSSASVAALRSAGDCRPQGSSELGYGRPCEGIYTGRKRGFIQVYCHEWGAQKRQILVYGKAHPLSHKTDDDLRTGNKFS